MNNIPYLSNSRLGEKKQFLDGKPRAYIWPSYNISPTWIFLNKGISRPKNPTFWGPKRSCRVKNHRGLSVIEGSLGRPITWICLKCLEQNAWQFWEFVTFLGWWVYVTLSLKGDGLVTSKDGIKLGHFKSPDGGERWWFIMVKIRKTNTKINKSKRTVEIRGGKFLGKNPTLPWDVEKCRL